MKTYRFGYLVLVLLAATNASAEEKIRETKDGVFAQFVGGNTGVSGLLYKVDTKTQLCFMADNLVPCESLAKRPDWKSIITWVPSK
jgi:hypothetical protein